MSGPEDVLFSAEVKAEQARLGSRAQFEDREWATEITDNLRQFLAAIDTFFLATASADGRPYVQHRGGPPGFLKPIGTHTLAFADFAGNRQYITLGHLKENDRARRFYEACGFFPDGAEEPFEVDGVEVPEVRYVRKLAG